MLHSFPVDWEGRDAAGHQRRANGTLADAIELVLKRYGICGHGHARWALLVYPDESETQEVNLISNGKPARIEHVLLAARELMLNKT